MAEKFMKKADTARSRAADLVETDQVLGFRLALTIQMPGRCYFSCSRVIFHQIYRGSEQTPQ